MTPSDHIFIHNLEIFTIIGLYEWEQKQPQKLVLDLNISCDFSHAINTDTLSQSIDYAEICNKINNIADTHHFQLLEPFADHICTMILTEFPAHSVTLKLCKPAAIANAACAGITLYREKN